jgi:tryptophan synthase alpha chain
MGRIGTAFQALRRQGQTALIPFITAGDPDLRTTEALIHALVAAGADLIELGVPFSDPMADGPTIQAASERALAGGTTLSGILELVRRVRQHTNVPIILMGYYNPVFRFGPERFAREAASAGIDGVLLVDLPPEERGEIHGFLRAAGLDLITLLAPTTPPGRRQELCARGEGFIYYVSMTGVTGAKAVDTATIQGEVEALRRESPVPVAVGFGISTPEEAKAIARFADAVVVGSALVRIVAAHGRSPELISHLSAFVRSLKAGLQPESEARASAAKMAEGTP